MKTIRKNLTIDQPPTPNHLDIRESFTLRAIPCILKNNALAIISVCMLVLLSASGVFAVLAGKHDVLPQILSVIISAVMLCAMLFLKEEYLHKASPVIYAAVIGVLVVQLCVGDDLNPVSKRYLYFSDMVFYTSAFLPLAYVQTAKMIGRNTAVSLKNLLFIILSMAVPVALVFFQANMTPVFIACVVAYITLIVMKKDKKINLHWLVCLIPLVLAVIAIVWMCTRNSYLSVRIDTILTRGQNDPLGAGWIRTILDSILMNTPLIGSTTQSVTDLPVSEMLVNWGGHNIMVLLAEYGWLVFSIVLAMYVCFFVVLFRMVHKTRQSTFARYTSLMLALSLLIQGIYSLIGIFLLHSSPVDMPFISSSRTINVINYLSFGIILTLYMDRNKVSVIKEDACGESRGKKFLKFLCKYASADETADISEDVSEEI